MTIVKDTVCLYNYLTFTESEKEYFMGSIIDKENANGDIIEGD